MIDGSKNPQDMGLPIFLFPELWGGVPRCDSETAHPTTCSYKRCTNTTGMDGVVLCKCCRYCPTHCATPRTAENAYRPPAWRAVLHAYKNMAPTSQWNELVLNDLVRKVNLVDSNTLSILHAVLWFGDGKDDDDELCRLVLELGGDAEARHVVNEMDARRGEDRVVDAALVGGRTALHFAAYKKRVRCLASLLAAGVDVGARTNEGKSALDLADDEEVKALLNQGIASGPKKLSQLAQEGKFFAIRYRIRTGRILKGDFSSAADGKTVHEWLAAVAARKHKIPGDGDESALVAHQVLAELQLRYVAPQQGAVCAVPPILNVNVDDLAWGEVADDDDEESVTLQARLFEGVSALVRHAKKSGV